MTRTYYRQNPMTGEVERSPVPFTAVDERVPVFTDLYMDGVRTVDGQDIGSRAKRRAHMERNGLADANDFAGTWAKARRELEALRSGQHDDRQIAAAVEAAMRSQQR
jgi:hypothetical protein